MTYDFTVITVAFNSEKTIKKTLGSVFEQVGVAVQHIVKDGQSTDQTVNIVKEYPGVMCISCQDSGIYSAMNQGLEFAEGKYILFLNSDDYLFDPHVLLNIKKLFNMYKVDAVAGSIETFGTKKDKRWQLQEGLDCPSDFVQYPHPGFFVSHDFIRDNFIKFYEKYKISSDYRMQLEMHYLHGAKIFKTGALVTRMHDGGISNSSLSWKILGLLECMHANLLVTRRLRLEKIFKKILK